MSLCLRHGPENDGSFPSLFHLPGAGVHPNTRAASTNETRQKLGPGSTAASGRFQTSHLG